jgi:hypothetical protein
MEGIPSVRSRAGYGIAGGWCVVVGLLLVWTQVAWAGILEAGREAISRHDYMRAIKLFTVAANKGDVEANYELGTLYAQGRGTARNVTAARKWYHQAADRGHAAAQFELGTLYERGEDGWPNITEARQWYQKAAAQGHDAARKKLAEPIKLNDPDPNPDPLQGQSLETAPWRQKTRPQYMLMWGMLMPAPDDVPLYSEDNVSTTDMDRTDLDLDFDSRRKRHTGTSSGRTYSGQTSSRQSFSGRSSSRQYKGSTYRRR